MRSGHPTFATPASSHDPTNQHGTISSPAACHLRAHDAIHGRLRAPFAFDRVYGAWWDRHIEVDRKAAVGRSIERIAAHLGGRTGPDRPGGAP